MSAFTEVFAWGGDHFGQLGQGTNHTGKTYCSPRLCSFNILIRDIACGDEHTAFIDSQGHVYTMGSNSEGRLGIGDRAIKQSSSPCLVEGLPKVVAVACGWGHSGAIGEDGLLYTWGVGEYGALGLGHTDSQWHPARVNLDAHIRTLSCGSRHTAIIASDQQATRSLYTFGSGEAGQLGTGRRERELVPTRINLAEEVRQVSCGIFHTGFVTVQGRLFMTGGNSFGQLGIGSKKSSNVPQRVSFFTGISVTKVACGHHSAAITETGELFIWGTGTFGEFSTPQKVGVTSLIRDVSVGGGFGAAVDINNRVWVWGSNSNGELGLGDYEARAVPALVGSISSKKVKGLSCGGCCLMALGSDIINSRNGRSLSPNTSRTQVTSPLRQKSSRSPLKSGYDRPALTSERSVYHSPYALSPPLDISQLETEKMRLQLSYETDRKRALDQSRSEEKRRIELMQQDSMNLTHVRELEDALKRRDIELSDARSRLDRLRLDSEQAVRVLEKQIETSGRQSQNMAVENQKLARELESKENELSFQKSSNASLLVNSEQLSREFSSIQKTLEDVQRRNDLDLKQRQDLMQAQTIRLRNDYEKQLQDLQTHLDEEFVLRKQLTQDLDLATAHRRRLEETLSVSQGKIDIANEGKAEAMERCERADEERKRTVQEANSMEIRLQNDITKLHQEVNQLESDLAHSQGELNEALADLVRERQTISSLQHDLSESERREKSGNMLESAVSELKFQVESLQQRNNELLTQLDSLNKSAYEKETRYQRLLSVNEELKQELSVADSKNRELFQNFERELTTRARDYRERTMTVLASPGPVRTGSSQASPYRDSKPMPKSERYKGGSPGLNLSIVSERSPTLHRADHRDADSIDTSPERRVKTPERRSPPTFREGSSVRNKQIGVKNSISEIRDKLASLQQNKSVLEAKMRDFEMKIRQDGD